MATFQRDLAAASAVTVRALPVIAILFGSGCNSLNAAAPPVSTELDGPVDGFEVSDGWVNDDMNGCGWRRDNASFEDGMLTLSIDDRRSRGRNFSCGEYRTRDHHSFGYYETRMRAGTADGVVTAFFTYTGPPFGDPHDEIDFEWLGSDTTGVQVNYFVDGKGNHEHMVDLGFDAADDFHVYGFEWRPDSVRWYVDCELVHEVTRADGPLPRVPGRIYVHLWNGSEIVNGWLGEFDYDGEPVRSTFDYIRHTPGGTHEVASSCAGAEPLEAAIESEPSGTPGEDAPQATAALPSSETPAASAEGEAAAMPDLDDAGEASQPLDGGEPAAMTPRADEGAADAPVVAGDEQDPVIDEAVVSRSGDEAPPADDGSPIPLGAFRADRP